MSKRRLQLSVYTAAFAFMAVGSAIAGQEPYVATVGPDDEVARFYIEPKLYQFTHQTGEDDLLVESFTFDPRSANPAPEVCNVDYSDDEVNGNYYISNRNAGYFRWVIRLPKKPEGHLQVAVQCGVLKPNARQIYGDDAVLLCAGEEGEEVFVNCTRRFDEPGVSPVTPNRYLPKLTVAAIAQNSGAGSLPNLTPFYLTAYRNPGSYALSEDDGEIGLVNSASLQVLDGGADSSVVIRSCMPKSVMVKKPVAGQINAAGETEFDLEEGDLIAVTLSLPRGHTMDVFCNEDSVKVMGLGEPLFFLDRAEAEDFTVSVDDDDNGV